MLEKRKKRDPLPRLAASPPPLINLNHPLGYPSRVLFLFFCLESRDGRETWTDRDGGRVVRLATVVNQWLR